MAGLDFLMGGTGSEADAARMGLLAAGLGILANNNSGRAGPALAAGAMTGLQGFQGAKQAQIQEEMRQAQLAKLKQEQEQAARAMAYRQSLVAGGKVNPMEAYAAGLSLDDVQKLAESGNWGRTKIKDRVEVRMPDGSVKSVGVDEYGNQVGEGLTPFKAPQFQDLGGQVVGIDPVTMKPVYSAAKSMTPGEIAANAIARGNLGVAQARLAMERDAPKGQIVQTENGPVIIDPRTGQVRPTVGPDGKPLPNMKEAQASAQRTRDATDALGLVNMADKLIGKATGSYIGAGLDMAAQAFGAAPQGAQAAAQLKAIEGMLVSKMPKMSGPQSDKDVQLYKQMAGQIGDSTVPQATKRAALQTIREIQERYTGKTTSDAAPAGQDVWSAKRIN